MNEVSGGFDLHPYNKRLKPLARTLRSNMTDAEQHLWQRIRNRQILDIQFYRQKTLLTFIVDFYSPKAKLVIELDGGRHFEEICQAKDKQRDEQLKHAGLNILRFDNRQVLSETEAVLKVIYDELQSSIKQASIVKQLT